MMHVLIRKGLAADVTALVELSGRTIRASYGSFLGGKAVEEFLGSGAVEQYVRDSLVDCWVAVREGRIVGYSVCRGDLIDLMMIDQAVHRQGLGTELLRCVEESMGGRYAELRLESLEANAPANAFYRKHGWREESRYLDQESGVHKIMFKKAARVCSRPGGESMPPDRS
jgi:ribosomal protein S18 acetylase RimI-like enzyme